MYYQNTQFGTLIVFAIASGIIFTLWFRGKTVGNSLTTGILVFLVILLPLFYSLTVKVSQDAIHCSFGIGLIARTIPIQKIESAYQVKNPWYFGWGVRYIPSGWIFNVSGLDAIEITLKSNGKFRIGTDDPAGLLFAIDQAKREKSSLDENLISAIETGDPSDQSRN